MGGRFVEKTWTADFAPDVPAKYRQACRYAAYIPDPLTQLQPDIAMETAGLISEAEGRIRRLNGATGLALKPLARLLLRTESIASSKVEGLSLNLRDLARAEARLDAGEGRVSNTALEVIANIDAMETAIHEAAEQPVFGVPEIVRIHERLMLQSPHPHLAGKVRTVQNWIGGNNYNPCNADFVPPPPEEVPRLLDDLCAAINDDVLPPVAQAALVHAQFETIHPFEDGNGRAGRALIHVVLRRRGVAMHYIPPISVLFANARDRYIEGLTRFRADETVAWIDQFAAAAASAASLALRYTEAVSHLQQEWRRMVAEWRDVRSDAAAWAIIDMLPAYPYLVGSIAIAATARSRPQVYQGIEDLVQAGVLKAAGRAGRAQVYEAEGLLDLLTALEQGMPHLHIEPSQGS